MGLELEKGAGALAELRAKGLAGGGDDPAPA